MKKKFIFLFILVVCAAFTQFQFTAHIPARVNSFTTDNLGNVYLVKGDLLEKYDAQGKLFKTFSNKTLGKITSVDVSNPLKLVVFYKEFNQVLFLDNMLSQTSQVLQLNQLLPGQITLVSNSHNNGLWLFDSSTGGLIRFDSNTGIINQTGNLSALLGIGLKPNFLFETNNKVYLNNPETGVFVFDIYGGYLKTIPIKDLSHLQVTNDKLLYALKDTMYYFNINTLEENKSAAPVKELIQVRKENENLYALDSTGVGVFKIKLQ